MSPKNKISAMCHFLTERSGGRISQCLLPSPSAGFFALLRMTRDALGNIYIITQIYLNSVADAHSRRRRSRQAASFAFTLCLSLDFSPSGRRPKGCVIYMKLYHLCKKILTHFSCYQLHFIRLLASIRAYVRHHPRECSRQSTYMLANRQLEMLMKNYEFQK